MIQPVVASPHDAEWPWNGYRGVRGAGAYEVLTNVRPGPEGRCARCWHASACELDDKCYRCGGSFMQYARGVALPPLPGDWP